MSFPGCQLQLRVGQHAVHLHDPPPRRLLLHLLPEGGRGRGRQLQVRVGCCRGRRPPLTAPTVQSVADEERGGGGLGRRRRGAQPQERGHLGLQQRAAGPGQGGARAGHTVSPYLILSGRPSVAAAAARWTGGDHQQEDRIFFILRRGPGLKCVNLLHVVFL